MAKRPVFITNVSAPYFITFEAEFAWAGGFALSQKRKNIDSMHRCFAQRFPEKKILEVSGKSAEESGVSASAFHLKKYVPSVGGAVAVESIFQSSKVFGDAGPFTDLLHAAPIDAKRDGRLKSSGALIGFRFENVDSPKKSDNRKP